MAKKKVNIDLIAKEAQASAESWLTEQDIGFRVRQTLDSKVQEIVARLLGFESKWGRWEVDHCNGRSGESAAGDYVRKTCADEVRKLFDDLAGKLPPLPRQARDSLVRNYHEILNREAGRLLTAKAIDDAKKLVDSIVAKAVSEGQKEVN